MVILAELITSGETECNNSSLDNGKLFSAKLLLINSFTNLNCSDVKLSLFNSLNFLFKTLVALITPLDVLLSLPEILLKCFIIGYTIIKLAVSNSTPKPNIIA